jgi:hypothetical protein
MAAGAAGIYLGPCSGHGVGSGSTHHAGLGGSVLPGCMMPPLDIKIVPRSVALMNATTSWLPLLQAPIATLKRTVFINKILPITDQDLLTTHPTLTTHQVCYTGVPKGCPPGCVTNFAWWCTIGVVAGREPAIGHARKHYATQKTVFIDGKRASVFGDPLGDGSPAFPCSSVVTGASINVFIGMTTGGI